MDSNLLKALKIFLLLLIPGVTFGQAPVLGAAAGFSVFTSFGAVNNSGSCNATGDIGSNLGVTSWTGNVNGIVHQFPDGTTSSCNGDVNSIYSQLGALVSTFIWTPALGSGQVFLPGVHRVNGDALLTADLILNGQGDEDAVFVIRVVGKFDAAMNSRIRMINGTRAKNIFWRIENNMTVTGANLVGTFITNGTITLNGGTVVDGRVLSTGGAINVNGSSVQAPVNNATPAVGPGAPVMGSAGCFVLFSSNGQLTNTGGSTVINGNVGSDGGGTDPSTTGFTGFTGSVQYMNASTNSAKTDLLALYNSLKTATLAYDIQLLFPATVGTGLVLTPHVYYLNGNTTVTDTLFIDAQGETNGRFVIQVDGDLTLASSAVIQLRNGARASNLFWLVEGDITIGNNAKFKGTIVEHNGTTTVNGGSAIEGRVLTTNGDIDYSASSSTTPTDGVGPCADPVINFAPDANNDHYVTCQNSDTTSINVQANDIDIDITDNLTVSIISGPANGFAQASGGAINYVPAANFSGNDTIYYRLCDNGSPSLCDSAYVAILVKQSPVANAGLPSYTLCEGDTIQIGSAAVAGDSYSWSPASHLDNAAIAQPMAFPVDTTNYILTVTRIATGCTTKDSIQINVNHYPVMTAGLNQVICRGDSAQVGGIPVSGYTYSWTPTAGLANSAVSQTNASPVNTTDYILTASDNATGCIKKDTTTVTVNSLPIADAGPNKLICLKDSVQLGTPAIAGNTYSWNPVLELSSGTDAQPMASPSDTTVYVLTVTTTATSCVFTDTVEVDTKILPLVDAGTDQNVCGTDSVLIGTGAMAGYSYNWTPATGLQNANASQTEAHPLLNTHYILTATDNTSTCHASDTVFVTVNAGVTADAGPNRNVCSGDSVRIGTVALPGYTYSWSPVAGLSSSTVARPLASPSDTTDYTVTVTAILGGCSASDIMTVNVTRMPVADAGTDKTICRGDSVLIGTVSSSTDTFTWTPTVGLAQSNKPQTMASPFISIDYILTVTDPGTGCAGADTVLVTVNSVSSVNAGPDHTLCGADSVQLGTTGIAANSYSWSPTTGLSHPDRAVTMAYSHDSIQYVLTVTNISSGCVVRDTVNLNINRIPHADAGADQIICIGQSVQIGTADSNEGDAYHWSPLLGLNNPDIAQPTAKPFATTTYLLTVTDTVGGCTDTSSVVVNVNGFPPAANAGPDKTICEGDGAVIGAPNQAGITYSWTPVATLEDSTASQTIATPVTTTDYVLRVLSTTSGCIEHDTVTVFVNPKPQITKTEDQSSCGGGTVHLGGPSNPDYVYHWSPSTGLTPAQQDQSEITFTPGADATYVLFVTDTTTGCTTTDEVHIKVEAADSYSGFSPNGDGVNDTWKIPMLNCYPSNVVSIVNRWGSEVFRTTNYDNEMAWDGRNMNGDQVPDGTYYYSIQINGSEQKGWVFIQR